MAQCLNGGEMEQPDRPNKAPNYAKTKIQQQQSIEHTKSYREEDEGSKWESRKASRRTV